MNFVIDKKAIEIIEYLYSVLIKLLMNCKCALQKRSAVGLWGIATTTTLYFINVTYNSIANITCDISLSITSN